MRTKTLKTARLGDLVAAAFDEAQLYSTDRREIARMATEVVMRFVRRRRLAMVQAFA